VEKYFGGVKMTAIAFIPSEKSDEARESVLRLEEALGEAKIRNLKKEKNNLMAMVENPLFLSDEKWAAFLARIRTVDAAFRADYLLGRDAQELILGIGWHIQDDELIQLTEVFKRAYEAEALVLELPLLEGDDA
jgi:hypothetical protein